MPLTPEARRVLYGNGSTGLLQRPERIRQRIRTILGNGVFGADGEVHKVSARCFHVKAEY